jgi:hypothetical protein
VLCEPTADPFGAAFTEVAAAGPVTQSATTLYANINRIMASIQETELLFAASVSEALQSQKNSLNSQKQICDYP